MAAPARRRTSRRRPAGSRARVRMYRQGIGDCLLIRLPRTDEPGRDFVIMIDCGVVLGTPDPETVMTRIVEDIVAETGGRIDLLVVTHEHWDHLSGFLQAEAAMDGLTVGEVWLAWTEDPDDPLAQRLRRDRDQALAALRVALARQGLAAGGGAETVESLIGFFGARGGTTADALQKVRDRSPARIRYRRPSDPPESPPGLDGVRLFVLGPPPDERMLKRTNPSKADHEAYGLALAALPDRLDGASRKGAPFDPIAAIPLEVAAETDFFRSRYWTDGEVWRRIDGAWLGTAEELALQLDNLTNNTSLVLAVELSGGDVLLFVADAQAGNWLSWQDLIWTADGRTTTGPDLLSRTILYKVGHHGSHNATLRKSGLDLMQSLRYALVPVDHDIAVKKRWSRMPLPDIVEALAERTGGRVYRSDTADPAGAPAEVTVEPLYIEIAV